MITVKLPDGFYATFGELRWGATVAHITCLRALGIYLFPQIAWLLGVYGVVDQGSLMGV